MSDKIPPAIRKEMGKYPAFYRKVWMACAEIPAGKTMTYGRLAEIIGHPRAARAVGQALARNPFAPVIPCHRVIRCDGKMGGYSAAGGVRKKMEMLDKEQHEAV